MSDEHSQTEQSVVPFVSPTAGLMERLGIGGGRAAFSFDPSTPEGAAKLIKAKLGQLPSIKDKIKEEIAITDIYTHDISNIDRASGEVNEWQRTVIFTADGEAYSCGSKGIWDSLCTFGQIRPQMPWNPPIKCKVMMRDLADQRIWLWLEPDMASLLAKPKNTTRPK